MHYGENCPLSHSFQNQGWTNAHGCKIMPNCTDFKNPATPPMPTPQMPKSCLEQGKTTYELLKHPQRLMPDTKLQMLKKNEQGVVMLCESALSENNDFG